MYACACCLMHVPESHACRTLMAMLHAGQAALGMHRDGTMFSFNVQVGSCLALPRTCYAH